MGRNLSLKASDGHELGAYLAEPAGTRKGGVVVVQEIFGVNAHIRSICDRLAEHGYEAMAPALFDRIERDFECGYSPTDISRTFSFMRDSNLGDYIIDAEAAIVALKARGPVSILGFGLGGTVAFAAAAAVDGLDSAISYYGGHLKFLADQQPKCPVLMHFGALDEHISSTDVERIRSLRGDCEIHVYEDAGHGFNCDARESHSIPAATLAWNRTLVWLDRYGSKVE